MFVALLVGVSGRSAGAAKLARASAAKSSGRAELATGAWAMSDAYINRTATKSCGEPVQAWCVYRLDTGLVKEMARFFGGSASVTELGAGVGRYARALTPSVRRYSAYDGMPGIEHRSHGWVTHGDVSNASLELAASDYVVTFEMAEHVPRKFESTLLDLIDRAATRGVILSWSDKGNDGVGHVNAKRASQVQQLFCARGFHLHSVPTRALRSASYYWYFKKNILVFEREPPTIWVDAPIASEMARQGTDMRRCGQNRCCRSAVEAQCIRGLRRNTTCMTAWVEA